jgi:UDP-N-acetylglucosamine 2-epimerase (non-hydrolysing)
MADAPPDGQLELGFSAPAGLGPGQRHAQEPTGGSGDAADELPATVSATAAGTRNDTPRPRVLLIAGTRPEVIKLAPIAHALAVHAAEIETRLCLTGQHTSLVEQVLAAFDLQPDWRLGIMREGQDLYDIAHGCLDGVRAVVREWRPDLLLVQGDTASVFFGGLAGFFEQVRVGHVEAGLRSGDRWQPWPEELFRRMTGVVSELHFAPTEDARWNLLAEAISPDDVFLTGNTVVDALHYAAAKHHTPEDATLRAALASGLRLVLVTAHRRESFGAPIREAFTALRTLADRFEDIVLYYPVHPNPAVREAAAEVLSGHERILLGEPLGYLDLIGALRAATIAVTDSGGIQEEAPTFGVPVLVLREVTERPEGVRTGAAQLVGTDAERILEAAGALLEGGSPAPTGNPYGDGRAGERIADIIVSQLTGAERRTVDWLPEA